MSVTLDQLQAEAEAISSKAPAIRRFALDTVSYLREQAQPIPPPIPEPPAAAHSDTWHVYGAGDPSWHGTGWYFGGANGQGDATSTGWGRQAGDGSNTTQRVTLGTAGIACTIEPNDPNVSGIASGAQASLVGLFPSTLYSPDGTPSSIWGYTAKTMPYPQAGETWWYQYAFESNAEYRPHGLAVTDLVFGNFNGCGLEWHVHDAARNGALGPLGCEIATTRGTVTYTNAAGYFYPGNSQMVKLDAPRIEWALTAGDSNRTNPNVDDARNTCLRFQGPEWVAGRRYTVRQGVLWSPDKTGGLIIEVDAGDGRGFVQWVNMPNVCTLWTNGGTVDRHTYPQLQNYRKADTSLPPAIFYYDGFTRGISREDVAA